MMSDDSTYTISHDRDGILIVSSPRAVHALILCHNASMAMVTVWVCGRGGKHTFWDGGVRVIAALGGIPTCLSSTLSSLSLSVPAVVFSASVCIAR